MIKKHALLAVFAASLLGGCNGNDVKQAEAMSDGRQPFSVMDVAELDVFAKVQSIDYATRRVTLVDPCGATLEFTASDEVKRLSEIKAGDVVKVTSNVSVLAEVRPATADEKAHPIASIASGSRAGAGSPPGMSKGQGLRVVTTVESADVQAMRVVLKGPHGDTATIKARNADNVRRLRAGDTVVLTYSEAVAASVVPAEKM